MTRLSRVHDLAAELVQIASSRWKLSRQTTPEEWCKHANVTLERTGGIYAGRYLRDPRPTILLNESAPKVEVPFIVAHELAHHLLAECRHNAEFRKCLSAQGIRALGALVSASDGEERLCDQFAGVLLLPVEAAQAWARNDNQDVSALLSFVAKHNIPVGACTHQLQIAAGFDKTVITVGPDGTVIDVFGRQEWPLTPRCRPTIRLSERDLVGWGTEPRWLRWSPTDTGDVYSTKVTTAVDETGCATMFVHLVARHYQAK